MLMWLLSLPELLSLFVFISWTYLSFIRLGNPRTCQIPVQNSPEDVSCWDTGVIGHLAGKVNFSETMWLQLSTVQDLHPGSCSQLTSANAMTLHVSGCLENLAGIFQVLKTCSEMLNLNDQNLEFEGHTFLHLKFGMCTLFDSPMLHPRNKQNSSSSI